MIGKHVQKVNVFEWKHMRVYGAYREYSQRSVYGE